MLSVGDVFHAIYTMCNKESKLSLCVQMPWEQMIHNHKRNYETFRGNKKSVESIFWVSRIDKQILGCENSEISHDRAIDWPTAEPKLILEALASVVLYTWEWNPTRTTNTSTKRSLSTNVLKTSVRDGLSVLRLELLSAAKRLDQTLNENFHHRLAVARHKCRFLQF